VAGKEPSGSINPGNLFTNTATLNISRRALFHTVNYETCMQYFLHKEKQSKISPTLTVCTARGPLNISILLMASDAVSVLSHYIARYVMTTQLLPYPPKQL
jgi:hypothetical protein